MSTIEKQPVLFHHALKVREDVCVACSHCMANCPTQAIRIREGHAVISEAKCVDCGICYRVCPVGAIYVEQDDFSDIFKYSYRVALIPAVLTGQFSEQVAVEDIYNELFELGFTDVYEVEHSVETIISETKRYLSESNTRPLISAFCPAVVRLIQVKYPSLVDHIIRLRQPIDLAALYYKKKLIDDGIHADQIGLFYITPCAAKIAAVKSPVGEEISAVNGIINLDLIYNRIKQRIHIQKPLQHEFKREFLTEKGVMWCTTGGEAPHYPGRSLAIDGIKNVSEFLEKIENDELTDVDFIEMKACDQGCPGGILAPENRFLTVDRLKNRAQAFSQKALAEMQYAKEIELYHVYLAANSGIDEIKPRPILKLDEDIELAMQKLDRVRRLMCYLPGFDCGVCGSPTCQALSEDIVKGEANVSHCIFIQKVMERSNKLSPEHSFNIIEKIWGKDRLDKNCYKKGAEHEGEAID